MLLTSAIIAACHLTTSIPQDILLDRANRHAMVESNFDPLAIHDNATGQAYHPPTLADAIALVSMFVSARHNVDGGIMQINSSNWQRTGLTTPAKLFDEQANVCAGVQIIAEDYDIERRVSCRYNTGKPVCANGYPEKIAAAQSVQSQSVPASIEPATCPDVPAFDAWAQEDCISATEGTSP